jgi:hypothetical protein
MLPNIISRKRTVTFIVSVALIILGLLWFNARTVTAPELEGNETPTLLPRTPTPSREAYGGCIWETLSGAGIALFAQRCTTDDRILTLGMSETLPGVFLEEETPSGRVALGALIRIFDIPQGDMDAVLPILAQSQTWNTAHGCVFSRNETESSPTITRYDLSPTGQALEEYQRAAAMEPVTSTCDGYGMGNSGIRYFEVHESNPTKALFLEIGQEAPLYDEHSIRVF